MFAIFTYGFVGMCYVMIPLASSGRCSAGIPREDARSTVNHDWGPTKAAETFGLVILLRAFANGCSAMTGTEAVSNGIPAFKEPKSKNAALTLVAMGDHSGNHLPGHQLPRHAAACRVLGGGRQDGQCRD